MRVGKLNNPTRIVNVNPHKYLIDWNNDGGSKLEVKFRDFIRPHWENLYLVLFQFRIPGSLLRFDFLNINKKLIIEVDGNQHNDFNPHFHRNSRAVYVESLKRDLDKEKWCEQNDIRLLRLNEEDLFNLSLKYIEINYNINLL